MSAGSLAAASPFQARPKRQFEDESSSVDHWPHAQLHTSVLTHSKRARVLASPSAGRCVPAESPSYAISATTLTALLSLYPDMDEKTVTSVLADCGNNIDAAIRRLGDLRLAMHDDEPGPSDQAAAAEPPYAAAAAHHDAPCASAASPAAVAAAQGPQTGEQWVEYMVQELASAKDLDQARGKAAGVLSNFERFMDVKHEAKAASRVGELQKENAILKRAVQLQHQKLQERAGLEHELQQLRHLLAQYQEQLQTAKVNNYALTLHLQQATNGSVVPGQRPPDVF